MRIIRNALIIGFMRSIPEIKRQPLIILMFAGISAIPLIFIGVFGGERMLNFGLIGAMVSSVGFLAISSSIQEIAWDRYVKLREMIVAMPVHPMSYALGLTIGAFILSMPGFIIFLVIAAVRNLLTIISLIQILFAVTLCWGALSVIGFTIATFMYKASPNTLSVVANILSFAFVFLPPVYYPELFMGSYSWVSYIFPTSNAAAIIRYSTGVVPMNVNALALHWIVLIITVAAFAVLVIKKSRWREV
jgi:ABC-type multidrug transport system permease subunit